MPDVTSTPASGTSSSGTATPNAATASGGDARERAAAWFETAYMAQVTTRDLAEDALKAAHTPALRTTLEQVLADARRHEQAAVALLAAVGREPARTREIGGVLTAKGREAVNFLYALSDGVAGTWRVVHQLYLSSSNSRQAFVVAHRLAQSVGDVQAAALIAPVIEEKNAQVLTLLDAIADAAPRAMLEREPV